MGNTLEILHRYFFTSVTTLFLFQSIILFVRSKNNIARRTLAYIELLWGLVYTLSLVLVYVVFEPDEFSLLREKVLVFGSFYIVLTHFFPIQVIAPGWLNWKRMILLMLPNIALTCIYYGFNFILGETPEKLSSYALLWQSIGHFNVWFRFVILLVNLIYMICILKWLYRYKKEYIRWKNENFSDQAYIDISWMRFYNYILIGIFLLYIGILFIGGRIPIFFHCSFVILCFSFLFYKSLFYENPYPEDFFAKDRQQTDVKILTEGPAEFSSLETGFQNEQSFENNIPVYTAAIKQWMEKEKPYLYNDFKLMDLSRILPLNRSYLSRVINDGFGKNFNEIVRMYRVNYAKDILINNPSLPIYKVAEMCGFSSNTIFIRAFKQVENMTPTQYKALNGKD